MFDALSTAIVDSALAGDPSILDRRLAELPALADADLLALAKRVSGKPKRSRPAATLAVTDWARGLLDVCIGGAG